MEIKTILVDDEILAMRLFELECARFEDIRIIAKFESPVKAIAYAEEHDVDMAILDIEMPEMNGIDLALQIKKEEPQEFAAVRPLLETLTGPTGREQVILGELLGTKSEAQDILNTPGFGLYDTTKEWLLPPVEVDEKQSVKLFAGGEDACIQILERLNSLIEEKKELEYKTAWGVEMLLGTKLDNCRWIDLGSRKAIMSPPV